MHAILEPLLTGLLVFWGLYILTYATGAVTTGPLTMLWRMVVVLARAFAWVAFWLLKILAFTLTALGKGLRRLLE